MEPLEVNQSASVKNDEIQLSGFRFVIIRMWKRFFIVSSHRYYRVFTHEIVSLSVSKPLENCHSPTTTTTQTTKQPKTAVVLRLSNLLEPPPTHHKLKNIC